MLLEWGFLWYFMIWGRKLNIFFVFITQSYFSVPEKIRLNALYCFIMKISNKIELQQTTFNYSSDIDLKEFMNLYRNVLKNHICLVIDATLLPTR